MIRKRESMNFYLILIPITSLILFLLSINEINYISSQPIPDNHLLNQSPSVKITSHSDGQTVSIGQLTISGISNDDPERNCIVYVDWNDKKPFQQVRPAGPGGIDDFSEWFFTYDSNYYTIAEGNNDLTSKITCTDIPGPAGTKWYSVNLIGVRPSGISSSNQQNNNATPIEEPSQILTPGFLTNFKNKKVQTNLENSTSIFGDEPSQKIIPGFLTNFKNKKVQTNLENSTSNLENQSVELESPKTHSAKDTETTNSFPNSKNSTIETGDRFSPNTKSGVTHQKNDSEIHMIEDNHTKVHLSENNNKSINTLAEVELIGKKSNQNTQINSTSFSDLNVLVTFPEPIIQNNNYSSELLVLNNSVPVTAAIIYGEISNTAKPNYMSTFSGITDTNGTYNFPLKISNLFPIGEYNLKIIITKSGSHNSTFSTPFFVSPDLISTQDLGSKEGNSFQIEQFDGKNNNNTKFAFLNDFESNVDQNFSSSSSDYENIPFQLDEFPLVKQLGPTSEANKNKERNINFSNFESLSSSP